MRKLLLIDRDGTLIVEPADKQVDALDKVRLAPGVVPALLRLAEAGYEMVMVSNQDGLGSPSFPSEDFRGPHRMVLDLLESQGIEFTEVLICPHLPSDGCACRKPATGLVDAFLSGQAIDLEASWVLGDRESDRQLAANLDLPFQPIDTSDRLSWSTASERILAPLRQARIERETNETRVAVQVELDPPGDGSVACTIETGIGFFDHMLEQLALHGGFQLELCCQGDLEVDEHHTVEDVALTLGEALDRALGDRSGIGRYGFVLPMDESLATVAVDLSGRPFSRFEGDLPRPMVGGLPSEMVPHFFGSLALSLRAAIHIEVRGENTHHMIEAVFKGVGRALRPALRRSGDTLPSSKGVL